MATIVGIEADGGAVLAGDRRVAEDGTVRSDNKRHVFDFGEVGAAATGPASGVDDFRQRLEAETRSHDTERGEPMSLTRLANVASDIAADAGVDAIVAAREDGRAGIRGVASDGSVLTDATAAFGSGAQMAVGVLEGPPEGQSVDAAADLARDALDSAADRDTATGEEYDTFRLDDDEGLV